MAALLERLVVERLADKLNLKKLAWHADKCVILKLQTWLKRCKFAFKLAVYIYCSVCKLFVVNYDSLVC
jgi:hypothetical protein